MCYVIQKLTVGINSFLAKSKEMSASKIFTVVEFGFEKITNVIFRLGI